MKPKQVFSDANDVLPDNTQPIPLSPINRGFMGLFAIKLGCILMFFLLVLFVGLVAKFSGDGARKPPANTIENN